MQAAPVGFTGAILTLTEGEIDRKTALDGRP